MSDAYRTGPKTSGRDHLGPNRPVAIAAHKDVSQAVRVTGPVDPLVLPNRVWSGQLPYDHPDVMPDEWALSGDAPQGCSAAGSCSGCSIPRAEQPCRAWSLPALRLSAAVTGPAIQ
jgi:hypothetical protein